MHPEALRSNKRVLVLVAVLGLSGDTIRSAVAQEAKPDKLLITSLRQRRGPDLVTQIFRVNADGSGRVALTSARSFDADPALSPDGRRIVFVTLAEGDRVDLYAMNADGSGRKCLVEAPGDAPVMAPSWSPDGKRIAFCTVLPAHRRVFTNPRLYIVDADGGNLGRLGDVEGIMPPSGRGHVHVAWS